MRKYEIYTIKCEDCCKPDCKKRQHMNTKIYCLDFLHSELLDNTLIQRSLKLKNQKQDMDDVALDKMLSMICDCIVKIAKLNSKLKPRRWFKKLSGRALCSCRGAVQSMSLVLSIS